VEKSRFFLLSIFLTISPLLADTSGNQDNNQSSIQNLPEYQAKDFSHLFGMQGFSNKLLKMHFTLYQDYGKNTNLLIKLIRGYADRNQTQDYQYQALKRRFGWEFDGMRLHELYFQNLGGSKPLNRLSELFHSIVRDFGSYEDWKKDFIATGMMRGIGWSVLDFDPEAGRLFNTWINEHDLGHLAQGNIILVMDV